VDVLEDSRRRLEEMAAQLELMLAGRSDAPVLADLLLLADGFTSVLLAEVEQARQVRGAGRDELP
jgi:hypothetical protein